MNYTKHFCSTLLLVVLTACGGGGSGDSSNVSYTDSTSSGTPNNPNNPNNPTTPNNPNIPNVPGNIDPQVPNLPVTTNDIVDSNGAVVQSAYNAMALKLNTPEGIAYRYGAPYSGTDTSPTLYQPTDKLAQHFGAPDVHWQFGGPLTQDAGDYATTQAQALFEPDNPSQYFGVSDIATLAVGSNAYFEKPELPWPFYGGGLNEVNMVEYKAAGLDVKDPYALGRCYGRTGWCTTTLTAFKNGLIATAGTNTSRNRTTAQLAPGKIPTGVALTTSSEFALISVWDTIHFKGQIAVVALAGLCDGCKPEKPADFYDWWGEWGALHPGLSNLGNTAFMKVLGYIDLPDGMKAPTEIIATTGMAREDWRTFVPGKYYEGITPYFQPLENLTTWNSYASITGENYTTYAKRGMAVVISKSEKKAAFLDLQPLFEYYKTMYFGSRANYEKTKAFGPAANQWPYPFEAAPEQMPKVVKTISFANRPTAVKMSMSDINPRAWIATEDGTLHMYGLGSYLATGTATPGVSPPLGNASDIVLKGQVAVGKNPTSLSYSKSDETNADNVKGDSLNEMLIVLSRAEKKVDWIQFNKDHTGGTIFRTLRDSRIVDPIGVEQQDNHGGTLYLVTLTDYTGKKVSNYRFGAAITFATGYSQDGILWACQQSNPCRMGADGKAQFEFGGSMDLPGKPFQLSGANVP